VTTFSARARRASAIAAAVAIGFGAALVAAPAANAATLTVTSTANSGAGSLREAIGFANSGAFPGADVINITATGQITLTAQILISEGVTVNGPGLANLQITRGVDIQMFLVDMATADQDVTINAISFDGGGAISTQRGFDFANGIPARNVSFTNSDFAVFDTTVDGGAVNILQLTGDLVVDNTDFHDNSSTQTPSLTAQHVAGTTTVTNSAFTGNSGESGGGVNISTSGAVTLSNSTFTDNLTSNSGGGANFYLNNSVTVINSTFTNSDASSNGGGALYISEVSGLASIESSSFVNCDSQSNNGGAVVVSETTALDITGSTFTNNSTVLNGGAAYLLRTGETFLSDNTFSQNDSDISGGAIYFGDLDDTLEITNSTFNANTSGADGSAVQIPDVDQFVEVAFSTFSGNVTSGVDGGALGATVVSTGGRILVFNDTFSNNLAATTVNTGGTSLGFGTIQTGAIVAIANSTFFEPNPLTNPVIVVTDEVEAGAQDGQLYLMSSTVVGNGAIAVDTNNGFILTTSSIIDGDGASGMYDPFFVNVGVNVNLEWSILTSPVNLVFTIPAAGNQYSTDPQLGALALNGGPTRTMLPAAASPAIDAGDPAYGLGFTEDQRGAGFARIVGARIDLGAAERQLTTLAATGLEISPIVPIGGALVLLIGVALFMLARRRRVA
jgi:hypothetical protein